MSESSSRAAPFDGRDSGPADRSQDSVPYLNLSGFGRLPVIRQSTGAECGLACLAMIAVYHGYRTDITELRQRFPLSLRGMSLAELTEIAGEMSLGARAVRLDLTQLRQLRLPCILHWEFNHFVVLKRISGRSAVIHDPARGVVRLSIDEVGRCFTGVALELTPTSKFKRKARPASLTLAKLVRFDRSFVSSFSLGLLLSLVGELLVLAAPFYMQITVDEVLMKGDRALLSTLAIGFALLVGFQVVATTLRSLTFQLLGHVVSFDMTARVFNRMLKLPANFFSNRQIGDIQHRVQGLQQIKRFLVSGAPVAILDGVFGLITLIILFVYSPSLTLFVCCAVLVYAIWRVSLYGMMRRAAGDLIVAESETQTQLLESLRTMTTIKVAGGEAPRESRWRNANARRLNAGLRVGNLNVANKTFNQFLFEGLRVAVIFVAARMVLNGDMTIGMLTAFMAYYSMFTTRSVALIDEAVAMKLLQVPLQRIADMVLSRPERTGSNGGRDDVLGGSIEVQGLAFKYGSSDRLVLTDVNLKIERGEFVAITGPSGAGKTTLLQLLSGLEKVQRGRILYDGREISHWNLKTLRKQIGVVLQDDALFRGSIAENVAFFDEALDMDRVRSCCEQVGLSKEIESMPMAYESLVGDLGSTLSGGQKQRVLLARALYKRPKILLLDEATSHLDAENEATVLSSIEGLGITRIVIAHRKDTIHAADRVIRLDRKGRTTALPRQADEQLELVARNREFELSQFPGNT